MSSRRSLIQKYPLLLTDLSKDDLHKLIDVLAIDATSFKGSSPPGETITRKIKLLDPMLRSTRVFKIFPNSMIETAVLCSLHKGLNPYCISHLYSLIQREVTSHLRILHAYYDKISVPGIRALIESLMALQGMWTYPSSKVDLVVGPADYQVNECEACMLARIVTNPNYLRSFRTVLLSRTRARRPKALPRLLPFIETAITFHPKCSVDLLFVSGEASVVLKSIRKEAEHEWKKLRSRRTSRSRSSDHSVLICYDEEEEEAKHRLSRDILDAYNDFSNGKSMSKEDLSYVHGKIRSSHISRMNFPKGKKKDPADNNEALAEDSSEEVPPANAVDWRGLFQRHPKLTDAIEAGFELLQHAAKPFMQKHPELAESVEAGVRLLQVVAAPAMQGHADLTDAVEAGVKLLRVIAEPGVKKHPALMDVIEAGVEHLHLAEGPARSAEAFEHSNGHIPDGTAARVECISDTEWEDELSGVEGPPQDAGTHSKKDGPEPTQL